MAMSTAGINNKRKLLLKPFSSVSGLRCLSSLARPSQGKTTVKEAAEGPPATAEQQRRKEEGASCWMPHHRTGIYFPRGQEWVMDDIPTDAASFDCTFWLRGTDGVDHHK